ncbi:hypothetical protein EK21DRAFT_119477 [Setomelanomma holmii]|uniref:Uncharacterized protein n=1 Tax=Setomelanomma holmii TaxID=210430 RepID=A0A9P4GVF1_9PLEO|nr:hypothetical protein EK21DRAFT_119477 [Setomelanomma holmii]
MGLSGASASANATLASGREGTFAGITRSSLNTATGSVSAGIVTRSPVPASTPDALARNSSSAASLGLGSTAVRSAIFQSATTALPILSSSDRPNVGTPSGTSIAVGGPGSNASPVGTSVASGAAMNTSSAGRADSGPAISSLRPGDAVSGLIESAGEQTRTTVSTDPSAATKLPSNQISSGLNGTLSLPPAAVDALQLAQFLKNLGVSVFNVSNSMNRQNGKTSLLASVVANISMQEYTQQKALSDMLLRTGSADIPPCEYIPLSNTNDMDLLMSTLKSIEVGAFMLLAESLSVDATPAAVLLSSIAGVAARQNAMLQACARLNTSMASFETPLSATWAYNLALNYVRPGSCKAELPIPILPALSIGNRVVGHARPNDTVTFAWDAAARAAAARSGKPLFIGWTNQVDVPAFTSLTPLGDGTGTCVVPPQLSGTAFAVLTTQPGLSDADDLTDATLAGPVVVSIV